MAALSRSSLLHFLLMDSNKDGATVAEGEAARREGVTRLKTSRSKEERMYQECTISRASQFPKRNFVPGAPSSLASCLEELIAPDSLLIARGHGAPSLMTSGYSLCIEIERSKSMDEPSMALEPSISFPPEFTGGFIARMFRRRHQTLVGY
ncbi:hypothetical protein KM043_003635 [Ampulex compressa]|nr:hypothetical protein KM043_003635 [Ampulex compressa]